MKLAILGGGITGVTLARLLDDQGVDWQLFEASDRLGGLCRSETVDGFVADRAGGHIIFSKHKDVLDFVLDALDDLGTHQSQRKSAIWYRGNFVQYPFENGLGDLPKEDNFQCLTAYIEAEFARRMGAPQPKNFRDWCLWRFGEGISEKFMFPYNEKIWKTDLAEMSTRWVAGRVPDAPVADVIRASVGIRTEGYKHQSIFWYPLEGGFESIVKGIARPLAADRLHVGRRVAALEKTSDGYLVDGEHFDRVVSTIPLPELGKILAGQPDEVRSAFETLPFTSVASILVALDRPDDSDRSWIYFPHPENGPFNRMTHISNYSPRNAPAGKSALMAEVTYKGEIDADEVMAETVAGIVRCGFAKEDEVLFSRVWKNKYAYIVYTQDLEEKLEVVKGHLGAQGIDILGRFGNYDYFNSDQCIKAAMDFAAAFANPLRSPDPRK